MAILRPSSDLAAGGWTSSPSGTLASCIDETTASDSDYIETTGTGNSSIILLGSGSDPGNDNNHKLNYRASSTSETLNVDVVEMAPAIVTSNRKWNRQPQGVVEIDKSALSVAYHRGVATRRGFSNYPVNGQSLISIITPQGISNIYGAYDSSVGNSLPAGALGPAVGGTRTNTTRIAVVQRVTSSATNRTISVGSAATGALLWRLSVGGAPAIVANASAVILTSTNTLAVGEVAVIAMRGVDNGTNTTWSNWKNGRLINSVASSTSIVAETDPRIGGSVSSASASNGNTAIPLHIAFDRALSDSELIAKMRAVWQIFKPRKQIQYFDAPKLIATRTPSLTSSPSDQTIDLTSGEAAAITDYTKLGLRFRT